MKAMAPPRFKVERGVPLSGLSTFGIGGPARYLARCRTVSDLRLALDFARQQGLHQNKVFVIGKGSNVLFDDRGYDGLVIANELDFCDEISVASTSSNDEELSLRAGSGYAFNTLGQRLSTAGWGGLEVLSAKLAERRWRGARLLIERTGQRARETCGKEHPGGGRGHKSCPVARERSPSRRFLRRAWSFSWCSLLR